jgi:hypothetical protein
VEFVEEADDRICAVPHLRLAVVDALSSRWLGGATIAQREKKKKERKRKNEEVRVRTLRRSSDSGPRLVTVAP